MSASLISSDWHFATLAASKGWRSLVTPAIMCGVFGYVIANFVGVFLGGLFTT